jgi:hypothetical protein
VDGLKIEHTSKRTSAAFGFACWEFAILGGLQYNLSLASYTCPPISWIWHDLFFFYFFFPQLHRHQAPTVRKSGSRKYLPAAMVAH